MVKAAGAPGPSIIPEAPTQQDRDQLADSASWLVSTLRPGELQLYHLGHESYPTARLYKGNSVRFSPFEIAGKVIDSYYAASIPEGAIAETVFRRGKRPGVPVTLQYSSVERRVVVLTDIRKPIRVIDLSGPGIRFLRTDVEALCNSDAAYYPQTQQWARAFVEVLGVQGILWQSRQLPKSKNLALFDHPPDSVRLENAASYMSHLSLVKYILDEAAAWNVLPVGGLFDLA